MGVLDGEGSTPPTNEAEETGDGAIAFSITLGTDRREKQRRSGDDRRAVGSDGPPDGTLERRAEDRRSDDDRRTGSPDRRAGSMFTLSLDGHDLDGESRVRRSPAVASGDEFPVDDEDVLAQTLIEPLDPILPTSDPSPAAEQQPEESEVPVASNPRAAEVASIPVIGAVEPPSDETAAPSAAETAVPPAAETAASVEPLEPVEPVAASEPVELTEQVEPVDPVHPVAPQPEAAAAVTNVTASSTSAAQSPPQSAVRGSQPIQPVLTVAHQVLDQSAAAARQEAAQRALLAANATVTPVRAVRTRRSSSGFGLLFSLVVLVALIVGGVVFGRDLLFPDDWDDSAKSYADAVASVRAVEYVDPFTVTVEPTADYRPRVERQLLGEWEFDLPLWRAFGLAGGSVDSEAVNTLIDGRSPALYSHVDGQIYVDDASSPFERDALITRAAVEASLDQQFGWSADHADRSLDDRALVDAHVRARAAVVQSASIYGGLVSTPPEASLAFLPPVLDYRLTAPIVFAELLPASATTFDVVAQPAFDATGAPITAATPPVGDAVPPDATARSIEDPLAGIGTEGPGPVFQTSYADAADAVPAEGDVVAGARLQLDPAVWFMSFAAHTDPATADRMTDAVVSASVVPVTNSGTRCWLATFGTSTPDANATLADGLTRWVSGAAPALSSSLSFLPDGTPQLRTCDPGSAFESQASFGLARQLIAFRATELATITMVETSDATTQLDVAEALERVNAAGVADRAAALPSGSNPAELAALIDAEVAAVLDAPAPVVDDS
ncbi:MAG: hypothetical protein AAGD33_21860 [Actinomycetota bacterium]